MAQAKGFGEIGVDFRKREIAEAMHVRVVTSRDGPGCRRIHRAGCNMFPGFRQAKREDQHIRSAKCLFCLAQMILPVIDDLCFSRQPVRFDARAQRIVKLVAFTPNIIRRGGCAVDLFQELAQLARRVDISVSRRIHVVAELTRRFRTESGRAWLLVDHAKASRAESPGDVLGETASGRCDLRRALDRELFLVQPHRSLGRSGGHRRLPERGWRQIPVRRMRISIRHGGNSSASIKLDRRLSLATTG